MWILEPFRAILKLLLKRPSRRALKSKVSIDTHLLVSIDIDRGCEEALNLIRRNCNLAQKFPLFVLLPQFVFRLVFRFSKPLLGYHLVFIETKREIRLRAFGETNPYSVEKNFEPLHLLLYFLNAILFSHDLCFTCYI